MLNSGEKKKKKKQEHACAYGNAGSYAVSKSQNILSLMAGQIINKFLTLEELSYNCNYSKYSLNTDKVPF